MPDRKISADPSAGSLAGTELVPVVQSGVNKRSTAAAVAALALAGLGTASTEDVGVGGGVAGLDSQAKVPSDQTYLSTLNIKEFGAAGDARSTNSGSISNGSSTLTAPVAFTSADVGKEVWIAGAGGSGATLHTTISSVTNSNTAVIGTGASTTVSGVRVVVGTDDSQALSDAMDAAQAMEIDTATAFLGIPSIVLPAGNYAIGEELTWRSAHLIGDGPVTSTRLTWVGAAGGKMLTKSTTDAGESTSGRCEHIDFTCELPSSLPATYIEFPERVNLHNRVSDCRFQNYSGDAIILAAGWVNCFWDHLWFGAGDGYAIRLVVFAGQSYQSFVLRNWTYDTAGRNPAGMFHIDCTAATTSPGIVSFEDAHIEINDAWASGPRGIVHETAATAGTGRSPCVRFQNIAYTSVPASVLYTVSSTATSPTIVTDNLQTSGTVSAVFGATVPSSYSNPTLGSTLYLAVSSNGVTKLPATGNATLHTVGTLGAATAVQVGTNPAATGIVRIPNNVTIRARNSGGSGDIDLVQTTSGNVIEIGGSGAASAKYYINGTTRFIQSGSGSPESSITASVGALYLRIDGGAGSTLYIKQTGTGNTGWSPVITSGGAMTGAEILAALITVDGAGSGLDADLLDGNSSADYVSARGGGKEVLQAHGSTGSSETIDVTNGNVHTCTLDANCTFTFSGSTASVACGFTLILTQDGTGSRTATWPGSVTWLGGSAPTLSTAAGSVDILRFVTVNNGTTWFGSRVTAATASDAVLLTGTQTVAGDKTFTSPTAHSVSSTDTTPFNRAIDLVLQNTSATANNYMTAGHYAADGTIVDGLYFQTIDHAAHTGRVGIATRTAGGFATRVSVDDAVRVATGTVLLAPLVQNQQSGTTYTLVLGDAGKLVELSNASAITLTVPTNASVAFPVGTQINLLQTGAGQVTVAATGGVTVNAVPGLKLADQWSSATLIKRATDTWVLIGDLEA